MTDDGITIPEFDSPEWRKLRDAKLIDWLQDPHAVDFVVCMSTVCETVDDLIDADKPVSNDDIINLLHAALVDLPTNPFFRQNAHHLSPVLQTGIVAWLNANELEKSEHVNDRIIAYTLRDEYLACLYMAIQLCRGRDYMLEKSLEIRQFFLAHETFSEYDVKLTKRRTPE